MATKGEDVTYLWRRIPKDLYDRTQARLKKELPPRELMWLLLELLRQWDETYDQKHRPLIRPKRKESVVAGPWATTDPSDPAS
jgi:hypothetical protein